MYLTYSDYAAMGGTAPRAVFDRFNSRVQSMISERTHGRVIDESPVRPAVRYAAYDLITVMMEAAESGAETNGTVASMSNDGVSVTYAQTSIVSPSKRYTDILRGHLGYETDDKGVPLMYCGVSV